MIEKNLSLERSEKRAIVIRGGAIGISFYNPLISCEKIYTQVTIVSKASYYLHQITNFRKLSSGIWIEN